MWWKIWLLLKHRYNLSTQSTSLQTLLLISTKIIVNVELLTTNLNKLHIIGSYKLSRKHCFTTPAAWLSQCSISSKSVGTHRGYHEHWVQYHRAFWLNCPPKSNSTELKARIFTFCFDDGPLFHNQLECAAVHWAACYILAVPPVLFQKLYKLTIISNLKRISIFSAILWKVLLISTDATHFYTGQIILYWIKI